MAICFQTAEHVNLQIHRFAEIERVKRPGGSHEGVGRKKKDVTTFGALLGTRTRGQELLRDDERLDNMDSARWIYRMLMLSASCDSKSHPFRWR